MLPVSIHAVLPESMTGPGFKDVNKSRCCWAIIGTREKNKRKNEVNKAYYKAQRRNRNGLTPKQQELKELKIKVIELKDEGLSYRKIAEQLNVSLAKVQRALKSNY